MSMSESVARGAGTQRDMMVVHERVARTAALAATIEAMPSRRLCAYPFPVVTLSSKFADSGTDIQRRSLDAPGVLRSIGESVSMQNSTAAWSYTHILSPRSSPEAAPDRCVPETYSESSARFLSPFASVLDFRSDEDMCGHLICALYTPIYMDKNIFQIN